YVALRNRIRLFQGVVGKLQPILSKVPKQISQSVLSGGGDRGRSQIVADIEKEITAQQATSFDLDALTQDDLTLTPRPKPPYSLASLGRVLGRSALLPIDVEI